MDDAMTLEIDPGNARQLHDWDGEHGAYWAEHADRYDKSYERYEPAIVAAVAARPGESILDVGCGSGQLAIDVARAAPGAWVTGADLSRSLLDVARRRAVGLDVEFVQADAQIHDFGEASFDAVISRTGTMFFADAGAAFANLARATRPGGRLVMFVWRGIADNAWLREIIGAIGAVRPLPPPPPDAPGPFALSVPERVTQMLTAAGWTDVAFHPADGLIWLGSDPDEATTWMAGQMAFLLTGLDDAVRARALENLRDVMARHHTAHGVLIGSGAWLVTAGRAKRART